MEVIRIKKILAQNLPIGICLHCVRTLSWFIPTMSTLTLSHISEFMGKTFQAAQLTHERFLTIDHSCKIFFWYLPNWTSTDLRCVGIRWVSVVEFHDQALIIGKVFGQESTVVKWSYQILCLHLVTVHQKVPILDFQSEFSMSQIIRIFLIFFYWRISI